MKNSKNTTDIIKNSYINIERIIKIYYMNAKEVLNEIKALFTKEEAPIDVDNVEVTLNEESVVAESEQVELAEAPAEAPADMPMEAPKEMFVTMSELESVVAEFRAMYTQILESIGKTPKSDVPKELSSEKEELSAQEDVEEIVHNPEVAVEKVIQRQMAPNRSMTTKDIVFNQLFGN